MQPRTFAIVILLGMLVPQIILLCVNAYAWLLVAGDATAIEQQIALQLAAFQLAVLAFTLFVLLQCRGQKEPHTALLAISLALHTSYLLTFLFTISEALPDTVQPWILHEGDLSRWNVTLLMPGAFLSLYALTKRVFTGIPGLKARVAIAAILIAAPLLVYGVLRANLQLGQLFSQLLTAVVGSAVAIIFLGAVIRVFDYLVQVDVVDRSSQGHLWIAGLLGIVGPLAGLWLNTLIPFPANFQTPGVYALTVINGLIVMLPPTAAAMPRLRLMLRGLSASFIAYFFVVFLPFLPLSLLAIIAVGAGFLILTPLALGLYQARVSYADYAFVRAQYGGVQATSLFLLAVAVLPGYFVVQASLDKQAIHTAINYFYNHDLDQEPLTTTQQQRAASTLINLRDRKTAIQLPYLDSLYAQVVFGDMVLADRKVEHMYRWLTGADMPNTATSVFGFKKPRRRNRAGWLLEPSRDVVLERLSVAPAAAGKATLRVIARNQTSETHSLFTETLQIPEGVFISALRLKIEGQWVDGQIFDRKTALWVFQKITEVRRDPALLSYTTANTAELRIYPFPADGVREVEIDLLYLPTLAPTITLGERSISLPGATQEPGLITIDGAVVPEQILARNTFIRTPYLHAVLDYSADAKLDPQAYARQIQRIGAELDLSLVKLSAANISLSASHSGPPLEISATAEIVRHIEAIALPERSGLWLQQALAKEMHRASQELSEKTAWQRPLFVVLTRKTASALGAIDLEPWSAVLPDARQWYTYNGQNLTTYPLTTYPGTIEPGTQGSAKSGPNLGVLVAREGQGLRVLPGGTSILLNHEGPGPIGIYSPQTRTLQPAAILRSNQIDQQWLNAAAAWKLWQLHRTNPAELAKTRLELLQLSRETNILLPTAALIVVEHASQWEILRRKEQQALKNPGALDFEEPSSIPAPSSIGLLTLGLFLIWYRRRSNCR